MRQRASESRQHTASEERFRQRAVEKNIGNARMLCKKRFEIINLKRIGGNGRIEAAGACTAGNHIPQRDPPPSQDRKTLLIRQFGERRIEQVGKQPPELVARMGIVSAGSQRSGTRHAAEDKQASIGASARRKASKKRQIAHS